MKMRRTWRMMSSQARAASSDLSLRPAVRMVRAALSLQ